VKVEGSEMVVVTVYSRSGCHLCDAALEKIDNFKSEFKFEVEKILIDGNQELEKKYGEEVPVILINGKPHDFFRIDDERFRLAIQREIRQHP
jgi:glutaredoxin